MSTLNRCGEVSQVNTTPAKAYLRLEWTALVRAAMDALEGTHIPGRTTVTAILLIGTWAQVATTIVKRVAVAVINLDFWISYTADQAMHQNCLSLRPRLRSPSGMYFS
jgi:hypothetical protein